MAKKFAKLDAIKKILLASLGRFCNDNSFLAQNSELWTIRKKIKNKKYLIILFLKEVMGFDNLKMPIF